MFTFSNNKARLTSLPIIRNFNYTTPQNTLNANINKREAIVTIKIAKQLLSPRLLEIFQLNKEEGLSVSEISIKFSITEQSVRNQLSKAVQIIKSQFKDYDLLLFIVFYLFI